MSKPDRSLRTCWTAARTGASGVRKCSGGGTGSRHPVRVVARIALEGGRTGGRRSVGRRTPRRTAADPVSGCVARARRRPRGSGRALARHSRRGPCARPRPLHRGALVSAATRRQRVGRRGDRRSHGRVSPGRTLGAGGSSRAGRRERHSAAGHDCEARPRRNGCRPARRDPRRGDVDPARHLPRCAGSAGRRAVVGRSGRSPGGETRLSSLSLTGRLQTWRVALRLYQHHPVLGAGTGQFARTWDQQRSDHNLIGCCNRTASNGGPEPARAGRSARLLWFRRLCVHCPRALASPLPRARRCWRRSALGAGASSFGRLDVLVPGSRRRHSRRRGRRRSGGPPGDRTQGACCADAGRGCRLRLRGPIPIGAGARAGETCAEPRSGLAPWSSRLEHAAMTAGIPRLSTSRRGSPWRLAI